MVCLHRYQYKGSVRLKMLLQTLICWPMHSGRSALHPINTQGQTESAVKKFRGKKRKCGAFVLCSMCHILNKKKEKKIDRYLFGKALRSRILRREKKMKKRSGGRRRRRKKKFRFCQFGQHSFTSCFSFVSEECF